MTIAPEYTAPYDTAQTATEPGFSGETLTHDNRGYVKLERKGTAPLIRDITLTTVSTDEGELFMVAGRGTPIETWDYRVADHVILDRLLPHELPALAVWDLAPSQIVERRTWDSMRGFIDSPDVGYALAVGSVSYDEGAE